MLSTALKLKNVYENHSNSRNSKKYSLTPTICWKFSKAFGTHPDPFISGDVCCYSQPRFDGAANLFHKLRKGCSPDHGSFPVAGYECQWPRVSCVKASGGFPGQWSLHWSRWWSGLRPQRAQTQQTWDRRRALRCSFRSFSPCAQFPCCFTAVLCITMTPNFSSATISSFGLTSRWQSWCDGFKLNVNSTLLKDSLKNLGDAILVREARAQ